MPPKQHQGRISTLLHRSKICWPLPWLRKSSLHIDPSPPATSHQALPADTVQKKPDVCPSCNGLVPRPNLKSLGTLGDIVTYAHRIFPTAGAGCPVCKILVRGISHFAEGARDFEHWKESWTALNIVLPDLEDDADGRPLTVYVMAQTGYNGIAVEFYSLNAYTESQSPWSQFIKIQPISSFSGSAECFDIIHQWIKECNDDHSLCTIPDAVPLPTRLLNIGSSLTADDMFLYETKANEYGKYVALSYVWGDDQPFITATATIQQRKNHITLAALPKTLQDAVEITRKLDIQYLWIDALCIIQDNEEDWATEASMMGDDYSNAYITIAATLSAKSDIGIFSSRHIRDITVWIDSVDNGPNPQGQPGQNSRGVLMARNMQYHGIFPYPFNHRGWAFQEHILSRRVIQYLPGELVWHCRTSRACECNVRMKSNFVVPGHANEIFRPISLHRNPEIPELQTIWYDLIENYTQRVLTYDFDKLPALSGLARKFQAAGMGRYVAGLWEQDFLRGLLWVAGSDYMVESARSSRPSAYRAPTWSWASVDGTISYFNASPKTLPLDSICCELIYVTCDSQGFDSTGRLAGGRAILRGQTVPATATATNQVSVLSSKIAPERQAVLHMAAWRGVP